MGYELALCSLLLLDLEPYSFKFAIRFGPRVTKLWPFSQHFHNSWGTTMCGNTNEETNFGWGSHDSQTGSMSQVAPLHNPSSSMLHSDSV